MSAHTKGTRTWCEQHCDGGCRGACMAKMGHSEHKIPHSGRSMHTLNSMVRIAWLGSVDRG
jgi:hypothetical protein